MSIELLQDPKRLLLMHYYYSKVKFIDLDTFKQYQIKGEFKNNFCSFLITKSAKEDKYYFYGGCADGNLMKYHIFVEKQVGQLDCFNTQLVYDDKVHDEPIKFMLKTSDAHHIYLFQGEKITEVVNQDDDNRRPVKEAKPSFFSTDGFKKRF